MAKNISNRKIAENTIMSVGAQTISLATSLLVNLIVPKFIDEYQYAYWQTYLLYAGYVGLLHFGILDGIVLRFSKYDYEELDKEKINFLFYVLLFILILFSISGMTIGILQHDKIFKIQICLVAVSIVTKNLFTFASYSFQITNRIRYYTRSIILQKIFYGSMSILMLAMGMNYFLFFCLIDIMTDLIGFFYSIRYNKEIYYPRKITLANNFIELKSTITAGITLLIANFSSNLIVGSTKIVIQNLWSPLIFGQVSFGFSITNIFLNFVTAISIVLFPSLKRMDSQRLPQLYETIRFVMTPLLLIIMLCYFPGCKILNLWIPKYAESLVYAGILLPLIVYSTKVSLLTNNYLKAYRKERQMLLLNLACIIIELIGLFLTGYYLRNLNLVLLWTVAIIFVRSSLAEYLVSKLMGLSFIKETLSETVLSILFIFCTMRMELIQGFFLYGAGIAIYIIYFYKKSLGNTLKRVFDNNKVL